MKFSRSPAWIMPGKNRCTPHFNLASSMPDNPAPGTYQISRTRPSSPSWKLFCFNEGLEDLPNAVISPKMIPLDQALTNLISKIIPHLESYIILQNRLRKLIKKK